MQEPTIILDIPPTSMSTHEVVIEADGRRIVIAGVQVKITVREVSFMDTRRTELAQQTKNALLQVLTTGPGFGLDLIERVKDLTKGAIVLHQGSVYPALRDLERQGFLRSWDGETTPERGGRPRRYYELTIEGRRLIAILKSQCEGP